MSYTGWTDNPYAGTGKTADAVMDDVNENFEALKCNFSSGTSPSSPVTGQLWADTDNDILKIYSSGWVSILNYDTGALGSTVTVAAGNIGSGAVIEAKIGSGAVTASKIGSGAVTASKIGSSAVTASKIGSGAVTESKLGSEAVATAKIEDNAVTSGKMSAGLISQTMTLRDEDNDYNIELTFTNGVLTSYDRTWDGGPA